MFLSELSHASQKTQCSCQGAGQLAGLVEVSGQCCIETSGSQGRYTAVLEFNHLRNNDKPCPVSHDVCQNWEKNMTAQAVLVNLP